MSGQTAGLHHISHCHFTILCHHLHLLHLLHVVLFILLHVQLVCVQLPMVAAAAAGDQCLYAADLTLTSSDYDIRTSGQLLVWNSLGEVIFNTSSVPTALAVDRVREYVYVASLGTVQGYPTTTPHSTRNTHAWLALTSTLLVRACACAG
jgi:hypothetical protein